MGSIIEISEFPAMAFDSTSHPRKGRSSGRGAGSRRRAEARRDRADYAFSLYVEGPRDGELLRVWARRSFPDIVRPLERCTTILGGRQLARAVDHFRGRGGIEQGHRGLVVLDRDHHAEASSLLAEEPGLEVFTWSRRHIESYLLVRPAIGRLLEREGQVGAWTEIVKAHIPPLDAEEACRNLDAKRLLGIRGPLARDLGRVLPPADIARSMRPDEFHEDVRNLLSRIRAGLGAGPDELKVVRRPKKATR